MLGITPDMITIDLSNDVVFKGITIYGVVGRILFDTWHQVTGLVESGKLDLDKIITVITSYSIHYTKLYDPIFQ